VSEVNLTSILNGRKKKPAVVDSETDSESNYKSAATHLNSKTSATTSQKATFKIEPNQNANMGFDNNCPSSSTRDVPLSFSDVLPKVKSEKQLAASSENEQQEKNSKRTVRKNKIESDSQTSQDTPAVVVGRRKAKVMDDTFEDVDENEDFEGEEPGCHKKAGKEDSEYSVDDNEEDNDDEEYDFTGRGSRGARAKSSRTKASGDVVRGRPKSGGHKGSAKNLDDKENEDDCEQYKRWVN